METVDLNKDTTLSANKEGSGVLTFNARTRVKKTNEALERAGFNVPGELSKASRQVYRYVFIQLIEFANVKNIKPFEISYDQLQEFLAIPGPYKPTRHSALVAIFSANKLTLPRPEVSIEDLALRIGKLALVAVTSESHSTLWSYSDEQLTSWLRGIYGAKQSKREPKLRKLPDPSGD